MRTPQPNGRTDLWTAEEDAILRDTYGRGLPATRAALGGRSARAITQRACRLGLARKRHWTAAEDRRLSFLWESGWSLAALAKRLVRTESGVYRRAQDLGLKLGVPPGYESVSRAARRCGFDIGLMAVMLRAAGVSLYATLSDPRIAGRGSFRHHYVDPELVDAAVRRWNASENIGAAGRVRGIPGHTLKRWLHAAGVLPEVPRKTHIRVPSDVIDRVISERRPDHAQRGAA